MTPRRNQAPSDAGTVATVHYHYRDRGRPTILIDANGIPGERIDPRRHGVQVVVDDVRDAREAPTFSRDGLTFVRAPTTLNAFDDERELAARYERELATLLERELGSDEVYVFDHTRRSDSDLARAPVWHVHADYTKASARKRLSDVLGNERAAAWASGHWGIVNVWRPIGSAVVRSPLGFANPRTVSPADWIDIDIVYPNRRGEVVGLSHAPPHRWLYLSQMTPEEVAIFNQFDSKGLAPVAHSALDLPNLPEGAPPRRSIESRVLVRYAA